MPAPSEYFVIRERERGLPGRTVRVIGVVDDMGGVRFAGAMHAASTKLDGKYPLAGYIISQVVRTKQQANETYNASELPKIEW